MYDRKYLKDMKTRLYRRWVRYVVREFPKHCMLKRPDGKYLLAAKIWRYQEIFPWSTNWVSGLASEWKAPYLAKRRRSRGK